MDCRDVLGLLHPYADGELDLVRHLQVEHHLAECSSCSVQRVGLRELREAIASGPFYHRAPDSLRAKIVPEAVVTTPVRKRRWRAVAVPAGIAFLVVVAAGFVLSRSGPSADDRMAEYVMAGHVRSLQVEHLTDVASSDRHTVKPWFRGKLDFAPQVPDLAADGFPLTGGRLDYLADRPVAGLVYHRRQHAINLFTWPAPDDGDRPVRSLGRQGYHLRAWQRAGMTYWAVSDLNDQELDDFVRLIRDHTAAPMP